MDVEFRLRVTSMRWLAIALGLDEAALVASVTLKDDDALLAALDFADLDIQAAYGQAPYGLALSDTRKQLFAALGDPTPVKRA